MRNGKQELIAIMAQNEKNRIVRIKLEETFTELDKTHPIEETSHKRILT